MLVLKKIGPVKVKNGLFQDRLSTQKNPSKRLLLKFAYKKKTSFGNSAIFVSLPAAQEGF